MALPITPTPVLEGEDAENFLRKLHEDIKNPAFLTPTPKIEETLQRIRDYASSLDNRPEQP